jgi:hypothetical protein
MRESGINNQPKRLAAISYKVSDTPMRILLVFLLFPLALFASYSDTGGILLDANIGHVVLPPTVEKTKGHTIITHNLNYSIVSGINIAGEKRKYPVTYTDGATEHHLNLAMPSEVKQFNKHPERYIKKLEEAEKHAK